MSDSEFLLTYTPDYQRRIARSPEDCFFGMYPTLGQVRARYGEEIAIAWLVPQLANLSEYCGARDKMTDMQMEECAFNIVTDFHYLKVSEMMLFFHRVKAGKYGKIFFGTVDPLAVLDALREFVQDRAFAIDRMEGAARMAAYDENRKGAVTYEEYRRLHPENEPPISMMP